MSESAAPSPSVVTTEPADVHAELMREKKKLELVSEVGTALSSALVLEDLLALLMEKVTQLMDADRSTLYLLSEDGSELWSKVVQGGETLEIRLRVGEGIAGWVASSGEVVNIADAYDDTRFQPAVDLRSGYRTRSVLTVPMRSSLGAIVGVLQVLNKKSPTGEATPFTEDDVELLLALGSQAAVAIDNSKLYLSVLSAKAELEQKSHELEALYEVEKELSAASDLDSLLERILTRAAALLGAEAGSIALLTTSGDALELRTVVLRELRGVARIVGGIELVDRRGGGRFDDADLKLLTLIAGRVGQAIALAQSREEHRDQDRLASIGRLMAGVLHDLKTPMTVISGYAQLMAQCEDAGQRERYVDSILRQFDIMSGMTREVLQFARGDRELMVRKVYLHRFVEEVVTQLRHAFAGRPIEVEVELGYDGATHFDEQKMLRVLHNLARNAAEAMPGGGHFWLRTRLEGDQLVIEAADDGPGIPAAVRARLFELFASGTKSGTGLGLAIVKKIVDDHGGSIACDTGTSGTTFTIRIPHRATRTGEFAPIR